MVAVFDKTNSKIFRRKASEIATQRFFYDIQGLDDLSDNGQVIEKFLESFERKAAPILQGWLYALNQGKFSLKNEDRDFYSAFLALQYLRTPEYRMLANELLFSFQKYTDSAASALNHQDFELTANAIFNSELMNELITAMHDHIWIFHVNNSSIPLYTSDNPVVLKSSFPNTWHGGQGVAAKGIQIFYPLSPKFTLLLLERTHWKKFEFLDGRVMPLEYTTEVVKHDNSGQVAFSTRFVFSSSSDFSFADYMCNLHSESRDPRRQRITTS